MSSHEIKAAERFDNWADTYGEDRISRWFNYYQRLALSKLPLDEGSWFLDVGCGPGAAVREAARKIGSGTACGIDISPKMAEKAKSLSTEQENIEYHVASSESIPYPDETFKSVLCTNSFHHYERPVEALREIRRVLRPDGMFVLVDDARDIYFPIWLQDRYRRHFEKSHVTYYTTGEMRQLFADAGWQLVREIQTFKKFMQLGKVFTGLQLIEREK